MQKQRRCKVCHKLKALSKLYYLVCDTCRPTWDRRRHRRMQTAKALESVYNYLENIGMAEKCDICRNPPKSRRLSVDYDPETLRVRGRLCYRCRAALGRFAEPGRRAHLLTYLTRKGLLELNLDKGSFRRCAEPIQPQEESNAADGS